MLTIQKLTTEYQVNPLGIDVAKPRFSWVLASENQNVLQTSYHVRVLQGENTVWDSGEMLSENSVHIEYGGSALEPRTSYDLIVAVRDNRGERTEARGRFETGLMDYTVMPGVWITHPWADDLEPCPVFFTEFASAGKEIASARLYTTALGVYEATLNGTQVGDAFLAPGWTSYHHRLQVQVYEITDLLMHYNRLEVTLANGWYKGFLGFTDTNNHYGSRTALLAQLCIRYADGSEQTIATGPDWQCTTGPRRYAELYNGEVIDYTAIPEEPTPAVVYDHPKTMLVGQESEPVRITRRIAAVEKIITPKGEVVLDFGQNLVGVAEARLHQSKGTKVVLRHAEVLDRDGNFYTENLRAAKATDTLVCSGGEDVFLPAFTFHGFRYLQVEGLGEDIDPAWFTACVLHTDMEHTGDFECSHAKVNRLWQNIQWGQRGNFLDIPTDCPQRDERLGWTGDAQVFASTAAYNFNTARFFTKWLRDLAAEQTPEQGVPPTIPDLLHSGDGAAAWGDAATIIPWEMYRAYGDTRLLAQQYPSMKGWVEFMRAKAGDTNLWQTGYQYGDWLALDKEEFADRTGATDVYLVATAYYAWSTRLVAQAARTLGHTTDAEEYEALHRRIIEAFRREYITETGRLVSETQTGCVLALHFGLIEEKHRVRILQTLENNLNKHNNHLVTGFVGTPYLCHALSENGLHELAGEVFLKEDFPSWLNCVNLGATTIWERWDSMKADGSFDESGMNSFNHYAYGSIGGWMAEKLGGLGLLEPGYKKARIAPMPIVGITSASAGLDTPYGRLTCAWAWEDGRFIVDIQVPVNTTAEVTLPDQTEPKLLGSGIYHYEYATELNLVKDRYSMDSTLGELLQNPLAVQILEGYMPGVTDNPMLSFAQNMTITSLLPVMPEGGAALFEGVLAQLNQAEKQGV